MQVEDVTRVCFATGRAAKNEGHLTVSHRLLGKIIKDDEDVLALVHEILGESTSRVRSEELVGGGIGSGCRNDDGIVESAGVFKSCDGPRDVRLLLTNGDVNTVDRLVVFETTFSSGLVLVGLRNNGVDRNGGLTGGAVTNDEFTLSATDGNHGVDGRNASLKGNRNGLPLNDAGSNFLNGILIGGFDLTFTIDGLGESVDDTAEEVFTDRNGEKLAGSLALHTFSDVLSVTEEHNPDFAFFKIEGESGESAGELDHLV